MGLKGLRVLDELLTRFGKEFILCVVSARDKKVQNDYYQEIADCCSKNNIRFYNRTDTVFDAGAFRIAIGWKWLISNTDRLIVLHDSLLPKYRGFNPLVTTLLQGDAEMGATAIWASSQPDEGNIIATASRTIQYPVKIEQAIKWMADCYIEICLHICSEIKAGRQLPSTPQKEKASYSLWRDELDYLVDWEKDAVFISRFVDALGFPYKKASTTVNGALIRIQDAEACPDLFIANRAPGKVFKLQGEIAYVVCGSGILALKNMTRDDNGLPFFPETVRTRFV